MCTTVSLRQGLNYLALVVPEFIETIPAFGFQVLGLKMVATRSGDYEIILNFLCNVSLI